MFKFLLFVSLFVFLDNVSGQGNFLLNRGARQQARPPPGRFGGGVNTLDLPDGADLIVGGIRADFSCEGRIYGYYADVANNCRIFHVCLPVTDEQGFSHTLQWSFFCGNQTAFNQASMTCDYDVEVDCSRAESLYFLNNDFGIIPPKNRF